MTPTQVEAWALDIIERVKKGVRIEDSRVELKLEFPEPGWKIARLIAGHANAARGEPILWLIGVSEKNKEIRNVKYEELANWWLQVESHFTDNWAPTYLDVNVPYKDGDESKTVVALLFYTDRPPYLVDNPENKIPFHEVTWREGTSLRTATRFDLLRLLLPITKNPLTDITRANIKGKRKNSLFDWKLEVDIFIYPREAGVIVLSPEYASVFLTFEDEQVPINDIQFHPIHGVEDISIIETKASIKGPGIFTIHGKGTSSAEKLGSRYWRDCVVHINLTSIDSEITLTESFEMEYLLDLATKTEGKRLEWRFEKRRK